MNLAKDSKPSSFTLNGIFTVILSFVLMIPMVLSLFTSKSSAESAYFTFTRNRGNIYYGDGSKPGILTNYMYATFDSTYGHMKNVHVFCTQPASIWPESGKYSYAYMGTNNPTTVALAAYYSYTHQGQLGDTSAFSGLTGVLNKAPNPKRLSQEELYIVALHLYFARNMGNVWNYGISSQTSAWETFFNDMDRYVSGVINKGYADQFRVTAFNISVAGSGRDKQDLVGCYVTRKNSDKPDEPIIPPEPEIPPSILISKEFVGREDPAAPYGYYNKQASVYVDGDRIKTFYDDGSVEYNPSSPGRYEISESVPSSSHYSPDGSDSQTVRAENGSTSYVTFRNRAEEYPKGDLVVEKSTSTSKFSSLSAYNLSGTTITVVDSSGTSHRETLYGSTGGRVRFENLPIGSVTVTESDSATGYTVNSSKLYATISNGGTTYLTGSDGFVNTPKTGSFSLSKVSPYELSDVNNKSYNLEGAEFTLVNTEDSSISYTFRTNSSGKAYVSDVPYGTYKLTETKAPKNFIKDSTPKTVTISSYNSSSTYDMKNTPVTTNIEAKKVDAELYDKGDNTPQGDASLEGAKFKVSYFKDSVSSTPDMEYVLSSTTTSQGTVLNPVASNISNFKVNGSAATLSSYLVDGKLPYIIGTYKFEETQAPVGFKSIRSEMNNGGILKISSNDFSSTGTYTGDANLFIKEFDIIKGGIKVAKYDDKTDKFKPQGDAKLSASFDIINKSKNPVIVNGTKYSVGTTIQTITTGEDGIAKTDLNLPYGTYQVVEKTTDNTYNLNAYDKTVSIREDGKYVELTGSDAAKNTVKKGEVVIQKGSLDFMNKEKEGDAKLEGAEFTIVNKSANSVFNSDNEEIAPDQTVCVIRTDAEGVAKSGMTLPVGRYQVKETKAPEGYDLNSKWTKNFTIKGDDTVNLTDFRGNMEDENIPSAVVDDVIRGGLSVIKFDKDKVETSVNDNLAQGDASLTKASFDIINRSESNVKVNGNIYHPGDVVLTLTTDEKGKASTADNILPYGTYEVKETKAPNGYLLNSEWSSTVKIRQANTIVSATDFENNPLKETVMRGSLELQKNDKERDTNVAQGDATLEGAEFSIYNDSKLPVYVDNKWVNKGEVALVIKTDKSGIAKTPSKTLPFGSYYVVESKPSLGYLINSEFKHEFVISEDNQELSIKTSPVNEQIIRGDVELTKADIDRIHSKDEKNYSVSQGNATLEGAVFNVINRSNSVVKVDGKDFAPGDIVTTITTDNAGIAKTEGKKLPYGTYEIKETKAPNGYLVNEKFSATFSIREEGALVKANSHTDNPAEETPIRGDVKILKIDKEKGKAEPTGNATLEGAEFSIYNNSKLPVYVDNKWVNNGEVATVITTDKSGIAKTEGKKLPFGTYYIKETKESEGYVLNDKYRADFTITTDGQIVDLTETNPVPEQVVRADIHITKHDYNVLLKDPKDLSAQGNASLKGAVFNIINKSPKSVTVNNKEIAPDQIAVTLTTDEKGEAETTGKILPYGTYEMVEVKAPEGYNLNTEWKHRFTLKIFGVFDATTYKDDSGEHTMYDKVKRSPVSLQKLDSETQKAEPQGDATLEGATYTIYNESNLPIYTTHDDIVNGKFDVKAKIADIITNAEGEMGYNTKEGGLPYGTYRIVESKPSSGYHLNKTYEFKFGVVDNDKTTAISGNSDTDEQIIRGGVLITKYDKELDKSEALGGKDHKMSEFGTTLLGTKFDIINRSKSYVMVEGKKYEPGAVVKSIYTEYDSKRHAYIAKTGNRDLPYGTYEVKETAVDKSYLLDSKTSFTFEVREEGKLVENDKDKKPMIFKNQVVRGDLAFLKLASDTKAPLVTAWILTNLTTGEEHVLLTDKKGNALTSRNKHSVSTNINDKFIEMSRGRKVIDLEKDGADFNAGIWFGKGEDGNMAKPEDSLGALPYGKYHAEEIKSRSNTQYDLRDFDFYITENGKVVTIMDDNEAGVINQKIEIGTLAKDTATMSHLGAVIKKDSIIDTVSYKNLRKGRHYRLDGILMDKNTNSPFLVNGKPVKSSVKFEGAGRDGKVDMKFEFDSTSAAGHSLVVFEELYDLDYTEDLLIATHKDIEDRGQTIDYPEISTVINSASPIKDFRHVGNREGAMKIVDDVTIANLYNDSKFDYIVTGVLMDKDTKKPFTFKGKEFTFTYTMKKDEVSSGKFTMDMPIDIKDLSHDEFDKIFAGKTVVAYQTLTVKEKDKPAVYIHKHTDLADENESLHFPKLVSHAYSPVTDMNMLSIDGKVVDTVDYSNLLPNLSYKFKSTLYDLTDKKVIDEKVTPFVPDSESGSVLVDTFNYEQIRNSLKGHTFSIKTELIGTSKDKDLDIISHNVLYDDKDETVIMPDIKTTALYSDTEDKEGLGVKDMVVRDRIKYTNLDTTKTYTITTRLVDNSTHVYLGEGKKTYRFTKEFKPETENGFVDVEMKVDGELLQGHAFTVFESIALEGNIIANHEEEAHPTQTINVPKVGTQFFDLSTSLKEINAKGETTLRDVVKLNSLNYDAEYELVGVVMDKETRLPVLDIKPVVVKVNTEKLPEKLNDGRLHFIDEMVVNVDFKADMSKLEGKTLVAFEKLYRIKDGKRVEVANHNDFEDKGQTVSVPSIRTSVTNNFLGERVGSVNDSYVSFTDKVTFKNLTVGNTYDLEATIMDKNTKKPLVNAKGEVVKAKKSFVAKSVDGYTNVSFVLDTATLRGKDIVVFEKLLQSNVEVAHHEDITDENQTINFPDLRTTAVFKDTNLHDGLARRDMVVVDTVKYTNLVVGKEYTVSGVLMDKDTGKPLLVDGKKVTSSVKFKPENKNGTVDIEFKFDGSKLASRTFVAFEKLLREDKEVIVHEDINDEEQTVYVPEIKTTLYEPKTTYKEIKADSKYTLVDRVRYYNLTVGKKYTLEATLMDKKTGKSIDGKTTKVEFTPDKRYGYVDVKIDVDTKDLASKTIVAFETLKREGKTVAVHTDINDVDQSVNVPEIKTTAVSFDFNDNSGYIATDYKLIDKVHYKNLTVGNTYTVTGTIMDKETNKPLLDSAKKKITATTTFTAKAKDGVVDVVFTFRSDNLKGKDIVVFENLYRNKTELAIHTDINDKNQTINFPDLRTTAFGDKNQTSKLVPSSKEAKVYDRVYYKNLVVGKKYTVKGVLMDKAENKPVIKQSVLDKKNDEKVDKKDAKQESKKDVKAVKDYDNKDYVTAFKEFTPEKRDGYVDIEFTLDSRQLEGREMVVFETLLRDNKEVITHSDIDDVDQRVSVPVIKTTLTDNKTGFNESLADENMTMTDTVSYKGLTVGKSYAMKGILMDKATGEALLDDNGNKVEASALFTPEKSEGKIDIVFNLKGVKLKNHTAVAFERLYENDREVAVHTDIDDEAQTVYIPEIKTTLTDASTRNHQVKRDEAISLVDTVKYSNLQVGKSYTMKAVLMDKKTNAPFKDKDGKEVISSATFVPEKANGVVDVVFNFNAKLNDDTLVAFETLVRDDKEVAIHRDIDDEAQTVKSCMIQTFATGEDNISKIVDQNTDVYIYDKLMFSNLTKAKYKAVAKVHIQKTGAVIASAEKVFTNEDENGFVIVPIKVNTTDYKGEKLVVTEELFDENGNLIGVHYDLNDEGQTVTVKEYTSVNSGIKSVINTALIATSVSILLAGAFFVASRKLRD